MPEGQLSSKSRMPSVIVHAVKAHKAKTAPPSAPPSEKMVTDGEPVILSRAGPAPPADEPAPDEAAMSEPVTAEERRQRGGAAARSAIAAAGVRGPRIDGAIVHRAEVQRQHLGLRVLEV